MSDSRLVSISQIKQFIKVAQGLDFQAQSRKEKYQWVNEILLRFGYFSLKKKDKSTLQSLSKEKRLASRNKPYYKQEAYAFFGVILSLFNKSGFGVMIKSVDMTHFSHIQTSNKSII